MFRLVMQFLESRIHTRTQGVMGTCSLRYTGYGRVANEFVPHLANDFYTTLHKISKSLEKMSSVILEANVLSMAIAFWTKFRVYLQRPETTLFTRQRQRVGVHLYLDLIHKHIAIRNEAFGIYNSNYTTGRWHTSWDPYRGNLWLPVVHVILCHWRSEKPDTLPEAQRETGQFCSAFCLGHRLISLWSREWWATWLP